MRKRDEDKSLYGRIYEDWYGTERYKSGLFGPDYGMQACIRSDEEIRREVEEVLLQRGLRGHAAIDVQVTDGVVTLKGVLRDGVSRQTVESAVRRVPDVVDLRDLLHEEDT